MGVEGDVKPKASANRREKQKTARRGRASAGASASWNGVDAAPCWACIIVASESSGAVRLGVTRDSGAYAVGCYDGDDYATEYIRPNEDWESAWYDLVEAWWPTKLDRYVELLQLMRQNTR